MSTHKLTKVYLESIAPTDRDVEIRDTVVPGFLCKLTPAGRRVFMLSYRTLAGQRRKMAEVWGLRPDGTNPCRHIPKYPENGHTRLITNAELVKLFHYLDRAGREELEHPTIMLAVRLQFEFAARMSEIINLQWDWIDFAKRRVAWPDSRVPTRTSRAGNASFGGPACHMSGLTGFGTGRRRTLPTQGCR